VVESLGLGIFDGFHLGHQELLSHCSDALTFHPHPSFVLKKSSEFKSLTSLDELRYFIPSLRVLTFNHDLAMMSAESFLNDIVLGQFSPKKIVVGYDYCFGKNRSGDTEMLRRWGQENRVEIQVIEPVSLEGGPVKSSRIRAEILRGEFDLALRLLGHGYPISGTVIHGQHRGTGMGFPTANLDVHPDKLLPCLGVYGGWVDINSHRYKAGIYIGKNPTFQDDTGCQVEVHIIGGEFDLYGTSLQVMLTQFIRPDHRFDSVELLKFQIGEDLKKIV